MKRRSFLGLLAAVPLLGKILPSLEEPVRFTHAPYSMGFTTSPAPMPLLRSEIETAMREFRKTLDRALLENWQAYRGPPLLGMTETEWEQLKNSAEHLPEIYEE